MINSARSWSYETDFDIGGGSWKDYGNEMEQRQNHLSLGAKKQHVTLFNCWFYSQKNSA